MRESRRDGVTRIAYSGNSEVELPDTRETRQRALVWASGDWVGNRCLPPRWSSSLVLRLLARLAKRKGFRWIDDVLAAAYSCIGFAVDDERLCPEVPDGVPRLHHFRCCGLLSYHPILLGLYVTWSAYPSIL